MEELRMKLIVQRRESLSFAGKFSRLTARLREPKWQRYGATLLAGKLAGVGLTLLTMAVVGGIFFMKVYAADTTVKASDIVNPVNTAWTLIAAFLVFGWHFTHGFNGFPAPHGLSATPFLAPFNEGHCGVALFMCLSGYLFAKILDGKQVVWSAFYWNRVLRIAPLLIAVFVMRGVLTACWEPERLASCFQDVSTGLIEPIRWDLGAWSIAIEIHFYCILWIIVLLERRWPLSPLCFLAVGLGTRVLIYMMGGDVAHFAYWTLVGRIDQFILGMFAWRYRAIFTRGHLAMVMAVIAFFTFYQWFLSIGGYSGTRGNNAVWIILPTVEASFFSFLVVYYDTTFTFSRAWYWRLLETIGAVSYSIYLPRLCGRSRKRWPFWSLSPSSLSPGFPIATLRCRSLGFAQDIHGRIALLSLGVRFWTDRVVTPRTPPRTCRRQTASVTFLSGTGVTFLSVTYTYCRRKVEMSPGAQSRNVTPAGGPTPRETASQPSAE